MEVALQPAAPSLEQVLYTEEEYFQLAEASAEKLEFYDGTTQPMPGGTGRHALIGTNLGRLLSTALLEKDFLVAGSDLRVRIEQYNAYVFPDALVVAERFEYVPGREDAILNPLLIIEVASRSTRAYDRGLRFTMYCTVPSFKEYVIVEQNTHAVRTFFRTEPDTWKTTDVAGPEATIHLRSVDVHLSLAEVYRKVL